jgi:GDP-L-fucose synthase
VHPDAVVTYDASKPDGMPRKLLDVSRLHALGWRHRIALREGIESTYRWFIENRDTLRTAAVSA